jgi:hypothetical protein
MKKLIFVLLFSIVNQLAYTQERTDDNPVIISKDTLSTFSGCTGWIKNQEGKWISKRNRIPFDLPVKHEQLQDYEKYKKGTDNFFIYELRNVTVNNRTYIILIKLFQDGYYKFDAIEEDWTDKTSAYYYIFDKKSYLTTVKDTSINLIKIPVAYSGKAYYVGSDYITDIQNEISKRLNETDYKGPNNLILHLFPYKSKNIFQFQIYGAYKDYNILNGVVTEYKPASLVKSIYNQDQLFKYCYYESEYKSFVHFLSPLY